MGLGSGSEDREQFLDVGDKRVMPGPANEDNAGDHKDGYYTSLVKENTGAVLLNLALAARP